MPAIGKKEFWLRTGRERGQLERGKSRRAVAVPVSASRMADHHNSRQTLLSGLVT